jgi:hypothetical protein
VTVLALVLPTLAFIAVAAYLCTKTSSPTRGCALDRSARIEQEHALDLFETNEMLQRMLDLISNDSDEQLLARRDHVHERAMVIAPWRQRCLLLALFVFSHRVRLRGDPAGGAGADAVAEVGGMPHRRRGARLQQPADGDQQLYVHRRLRPEVADSPQLAAIERAVGSDAKLTRQLLAFARKQALLPERMTRQERLPALLDAARVRAGFHHQTQRSSQLPKCFCTMSTPSAGMPLAASRVGDPPIHQEQRHA